MARASGPSVSKRRSGRSSGRTHALQVTYAGHPLYTFKGGGAPGMTGTTSGRRRAGGWMLPPAGKMMKTTPK
jgi:Secreted repeat of unknown function